MSCDCVFGKCFFFLAPLHRQMGFDIVPREQIGAAEYLHGIC